MKNRISVCVASAALIFAALGFPLHSNADQPAAPKLETLLTAEIERIEGTDLIVSRVVMPPHTELPRHWHPGEEFAYVLEGSTVLRRDGKPDLTVAQGEIIKISLREVHSALTTDQGATILVFRVHEHGQPERVLVD